MTEPGVTKKPLKPQTGLYGWWERLIEEPGLLGRVRRQWPWVVVVGFVVLGLGLIALRVWDWGAGLIGVGMVSAGLFRTFMKSPGIITIRSRLVDLLFYYGLGIAIIVFAAIVPEV
ncbi:MAG: DUF3017 domain-containing protein [Propionibacteriaceae bacterium]|jgi:hypothetical protein|nr:DUF3017 domain-containing protein [Propionibacteriaceae bacterium]